VVFEADYAEIELQNIAMTSFQWCHYHYITENVTKITSQKIFQFGLLPIKVSGYASGLGLIIWWSLKKRSWSWKSVLGLGLTGLGLEKIGGLGLVT